MIAIPITITIAIRSGPYPTTQSTRRRKLPRVRVRSTDSINSSS